MRCCLKGWCRLLSLQRSRCGSGAIRTCRSAKERASAARVSLSIGWVKSRPVTSAPVLWVRDVMVKDVMDGLAKAREDPQRQRGHGTQAQYALRGEAEWRVAIAQSQDSTRPVRREYRDA